MFIASVFAIMVPFDPNGIDGLNKGDVLILISAVTFAMHTAALGVFAPKRD